MLSDIVAAGQIVELQAMSNEPEESGRGQNKIYRTKVFDVLSKDQLEIMMPIVKGKVVLLPVDGEYDLCFYVGKGLYQCFARVLDRYKSNNIYIVVMELTSNLRKHQRREFYRLGCAMVMTSRELEPEEMMAIQQGRVYVAPGRPMRRNVVVDISGGGLRFIANYSYKAGAYIYCTYSLNIKGLDKPYNLVGKILSVRPVEGQPGNFEHRLQYVNMDADEQEEIIKYIFEEERRQRFKRTNKK